MKKEDDEIYDLYKIETKPKVNKQKITIILIAIMILILLSVILIRSLEAIKQYNVYKQYEQQLISLKKQEEEKQKQIAAQKEKQRQEKLPKLTDVGKQNIEHIYKSETKRAFLTFDDGPSGVTSQILDTLKQENVKATFFVLGSKAQNYPDMIKRMYEEGHYIANHGYSHVYSTIYASKEAVLDEFNKCNDIVKNILGEQEYNSHLFRFPGGLVGGKYGEIKMQAKEILNQNNIVNVDWNALTGDSESTNPTIDFELQRLKETTTNKNSIVILMHDAEAKKATADALPQIIGYLREQGYEFKNFYEIIK